MAFGKFHIQDLQLSDPHGQVWATNIRSVPETVPAPDGDNPADSRTKPLFSPHPEKYIPGKAPAVPYSEETLPFLLLHGEILSKSFPDLLPAVYAVRKKMPATALK